MLGPMKTITRSLLISWTLTSHLFLSACGTLGPQSLAPDLKLKSPNEISIMNFNVENLFDNIDDPDRDDAAYLPLSQKQSPAHQALCAQINHRFYREECLGLDWSEEVLAAKLKNLSQVILGVDQQGPDILVLQEVENDRILSRLNKEHLAKAGYQTQVLIEGFDTRGIDIALLSRFPLAGEPQLHRIPYVAQNDQDKKGMERSRGILEVPLKLPTGEKLIVLGAHFPSQANPTYWREQSVAFMATLIKEKSAQDMVIASGDLNITTEEEAKTGFFKKTFSEVALVSHLVGCQKCLGTHHYRRDWSFLDVLLFSKNMNDQGQAAYTLDPNSIRVINSDPIQLRGNTPQRFKPETKEGVADHFPLYARLKARSVSKK